MRDDKHLFELFKSQKTEFADNGFSQHLMKRLPGRSRLVTQIIIVICLLVGMILTVCLQGDKVIIESICSIAKALNYAQLPSIQAIAGYLIGLLIIGCMSVSIYSLND